jgi:hypothetical protein
LLRSTRALGTRRATVHARARARRVGPTRATLRVTMRDNMAPSFTFIPIGDGDCTHLEQAVALPTAFTLVEVGA